MNSFWNANIDEIENQFGIERVSVDILDINVEPYRVHLSYIEDETVSIIKKTLSGETLIADGLTVKSARLIVKELNELYKYRSL